MGEDELGTRPCATVDFAGLNGLALLVANVVTVSSHQHGSSRSDDLVNYGVGSSEREYPIHLVVRTRNETMERHGHLI